MAQATWPEDASNPLITYTIFNDRKALTKQEFTTTWQEIVGRVGNPETAVEKEDLKLISLCQYGSVLSFKRSLRHQENILWVYGIELDYDLEIMPMAEAAQKLQAAKLESVLYTSPSHKPDKPRWRVLLPLSKKHAPEAREELVGRANKLFDGVISDESFRLTQSFYLGQKIGVIYEVLVTHGRTIDALNIPPRYFDAKRPDNEIRFDSTTDAELREAFVRGSGRYNAILKLSSRWAARGMPEDDIVSALHSLFDGNSHSTINKDGTDLRAEVLNAAKTACNKYGETRAVPTGTTAPSTSSTVDFNEGPPCLQSMSASGFPLGTLRDSLFAIGVYLKKRYPDSWEEHIEKYNQSFMKPVVGAEATANIIKSLRKKNYNFSCKKEPLSSHCNKVLCRTRDFGVGKEAAWNVIFDPLGTLKIMTDPPYWIVSINGRQMRITSEDWSSQLNFGRKCLETVDYMPSKLTAARWADVVNETVRSATQIPAPKDASPSGQLEFHLRQFCTSFAQAETREEIITGKPFKEGDRIYFRIADFRRYLEAQHFRSLTDSKLYEYMREMNVDHGQLRVGEANVRVWSVPAYKDPDINIPPRQDNSEGAM